MTAALPFLFALISGCSTSSGEVAHAPVESVGPVAVTSVEARSVEIPVLIEANGQIVGGHEARVASGATGRVVDVRVERGSTVSKGEVLAVIDDRLLTSTRDEARAAVAQAAANATVADDECKRAKALFDKGLSNEAARLRADAQCATARAALEAAEARLRAAEARVSDTRLKAPFAGVIGERMVSPGEYVRDDTTVATLVGNADIRLELTLGERQAMRVTGGEIVHFRVSGDDVDREAVIDRISPSLRDRGRDLVVEARISEHDLVGLRPGAFVRAGVETAAQTAVLVPVSAVARDGSATRAWVVNEGRAEERIVAVGAVQGEEIPVLDGLVPGERVISPIPGGLRDGAAVVE